MKSIFVGVCMAIVTAIGFCGCEDVETADEYRTLKAELTGVIPTLGRYSINTAGNMSVNSYKYQKSFVVTATNMISYTSDTFADYDIPIHDGGVSFSNGNHWWYLGEEKVVMEDESGNCAPSDAFAIHAQWTSPNHCEGTIWCNDTNMFFTADRN